MKAIHSKRKPTSAYRQSIVKETNREAALTASLLATGSGGVMLGAIFGPIVAVIGGVVGVTAAYIVEQKNLSR